MKCVEPGGALYARKLAKVTANVLHEKNDDEWMKREIAL